MPGIPSSRSCDACRRQKKKCDEGKPACSRCTRLRIQCVGCGERRFMFKVQTTAKARSKSKSKSMKPEEVWTPTDNKPVLDLALGRPRMPLSNDETVAIGAFVSVLQVTDARYDVSGNSGFMQYIPRRLGSNPLLDASANAFVSAYSTVWTGHTSLQAYSRFGRALRCLRDCVADPVKCSTAETLCSMYLILLAQGWIVHPKDERVSHANAMSHILHNVSSQEWQGEFESKVLHSACMTVVLWSMCKPHVKLSPWLVDLKMMYYGPRKPWNCSDGTGTGTQSMRLEEMTLIPDYFCEPELHLQDIAERYQAIRDESAELFTFVTKGFKHQLSDKESGQNRRLVHLQSLSAIVAAMALSFNTILQIFQHGDTAKLSADAEHLTSEIMTIAKASERYRPIGAAHIPMCLAIIYASTNDARKRSNLVEALEDFSRDLQDTQWMELATWLEQKYAGIRQRRLRLLE